MGSVGTATVATGAAATTAAAGAATAATTAAVTTGTAAAATAAGGALAAKITAGVLAAALAVGGAGVATGIIPTPWTAEEATPTTWTEETEPTEQTQPVDYSSDLLAPLGESREFQESFADYPSNRVTYYLTKDGKLAARKAPHTEVDFGANVDIREVLVVGQFPVGKDAQNTYYMHTRTQVLPLAGMTGTPVAIIAVGQQNVLSYYAVISLSGGQLYYNHYSPAGQKIDYDNVPVYIYDQTDQGNTLKNITWFEEIMNPNGSQNTWSFRFVADGKVYKMASFNPRISQESAVCLAEATGVAGNDLLSTEGNPSLICKAATAIHVDDTAITLPEGKTGESVSYAVGVQTGLVFFNDGSVYAYDQTGMTLNQELTDLNQKGAICKVFTAYTSAQNIFLIMDNNITYVLQ